jgi:hypothetical protein
VAGAGGSSLVVNVSFASGSVGAKYVGVSASASGGSGTYSFRASGLPKGVKASRDGMFSGTPTTAGDYTVTVSATDTSKPTELTGSTTAMFVVSRGNPTLSVKSYMAKVAESATVILTAYVHGTAKGQPDTGTVTFASNGSPITCVKTVVAPDRTVCSFPASSLGGVIPPGGSLTFDIEANISQDVNYDAASAAGQVTIYK